MIYMDETYRALLAMADEQEAKLNAASERRERLVPNERRVVIRKTFETPRVQSLPALQETPRMSVEDSRSWNDWVDGRIERRMVPAISKALDKVSDVISSEVGLIEKRLMTKLQDERAKFAAEHQKLTERVIKLEVMLDIMRGFITSGNAKMLTIKGGKSDAA